MTLRQRDGPQTFQIPLVLARQHLRQEVFEGLDACIGALLCPHCHTLLFGCSVVSESLLDCGQLPCPSRSPRVWRSNQSILKEINPEYSLEGLMLKLQYFGHLM